MKISTSAACPDDNQDPHALGLSITLDHLSQVTSFAIFHENVQHVVWFVNESLIVPHNAIIASKLLEDIAG